MKVCEKCGAKIDFIKTQRGGFMPVNVGLVGYTVGSSGKDTVVTPSGEVLKKVKVTDQPPFLGQGYIPHWVTCGDPDAFRKSDKNDKQLELDI